MTGLLLDDVGIRHDGQTLLHSVSLEVREGESLCLVGASGSGKSLLAAAAAGLLPGCMAATGTIRVHDRSVPAAKQARLRALWHTHLCLLPQEPTSALAPLLRALDQVRLAQPRLGRAEALAWLGRFGLDREAARRMPFELSGGMAQRLLAALAMRTGSRVLIADEPTKGLDAERRTGLIGLLVQLREAGRALFVISHDMDLVRALGGRVAVLEGGTIVEQGSTATVFTAPRSSFARACLAAASERRRRSATRSGDTVAEGQALVIGHGRKRLAGPLNLALSAGKVTGLLGPSGIGKTTLGDTLLGLLPSAAGHVAWLGSRLDRATLRRLRPRFQKLHQDPTTVFPSQQPVGASIADLKLLGGQSDIMQRLPPLLDRLGLSARLLDRRPHELSGGEVQRLALARILLARPALLVADEPSSRLDPPVQAAAIGLLRTLADADGMAVLLITHDQRMADAVADDAVKLTPAGPEHTAR